MSVEYIVSACLAGRKCKYDGQSNPCREVMELVGQGRALPVCPECMSGLPIPRSPCEQRHGRVFSRDGDDWTEALEKGAEKALEIALASGAGNAILKCRSPSCGCGEIYDGTFSGKVCAGNGIWARKLLEAGFEIYSEEKLPEPL